MFYAKCVGFYGFPSRNQFFTQSHGMHSMKQRQEKKQIGKNVKNEGDFSIDRGKGSKWKSMISAWGVSRCFKVSGGCEVFQGVWWCFHSINHRDSSNN